MDSAYCSVLVALITIVVIKNSSALPVSTLNNGQHEWRRSGHRIEDVFPKINTGHLALENAVHKTKKRLTPSSVDLGLKSFENPPTAAIPGVSMIPPVAKTDLKGIAVLRAVATLAVLDMKPSVKFLVGLNAISYITSALSISSAISNAIILGEYSFDLTTYAEGMLSTSASSIIQFISITKTENETIVVGDC